MAIEAMGEPVLESPATAPRTPWARYLAWRRWGMLAVILLVIISNYSATFGISVLLEPIKHDFHVSDTALGLLSGLCFSLFYAVAAVPLARWADYGNRRTVLVVTLTAWSAMTALCGTARSFWQLALARFGVGAAASGALPPAQSLIADYFPPKHRGTAIGLLNAALNIGLFLGVGLCGMIAAAEGWRAALLWLGLPGLALAVVARLTLAEPREEGLAAEHVESVESLAQSAKRLRSKRSFVYALIAISVYCIFAYGSSTFMPSFMMRTLHASMRQASAVWATVILSANVTSSIVGGWLGDRLSARNLSWYGRLPALSCLGGAVLYWLAFWSPNYLTFISVEFCAELVLGIGFPTVYAGVHRVCGGRRRGLAIGILFLAMVLCGNTIGPLVVGALSDALNAICGEASLRYSLLALCFVMVPAAAAFWAGGRSIPHDLEE